MFLCIALNTAARRFRRKSEQFRKKSLGYRHFGNPETQGTAVSNLRGSTNMSTYVYWTRAPKEPTRIPEQVGRWETKLTRYPPTNIAWSDRYLTMPLHNLRLLLGLFIRRWHSRSIQRQFAEEKSHGWRATDLTSGIRFTVRNTFR